MASTKRGMLAEDVPWSANPAGVKPVPRIHQNPVFRIQPSDPKANYALAVMKHPDPVGGGFGMEARLEDAGPDCLVPGLAKAVKLLGVKIWPIEVDFKFLEPLGRGMRTLGKSMDLAVNLMSASFQDR